MVTKSKLKGFTIVELLIVIVVIGILAAITIVSYGTVTQRANTASEQTAAEAAVRKAEVYKTINGAYPATLATLLALPSSDTSALTGVVYSSFGTGATAPTGTMNQIIYYLCGVASAGAATSYATLTAAGSTYTGVAAAYWDFTAGNANASYPLVTGTPTYTGGTYSTSPKEYSGQVTGTYNTYAVTCWASGS